MSGLDGLTYGLDCLIYGFDCVIYGLDCLVYGLDCLIYGLDRLICAAFARLDGVLPLVRPRPFYDGCILCARSGVGSHW